MRTSPHLPVLLLFLLLAALVAGSPILKVDLADKAPSLVDDEAGLEMDSEVSRRVLERVRRYISYEVLRADVVPCTRPGVPYYNCHAPARFDAYHRACGIITRCARYDYP